MTSRVGAISCPIGRSFCSTIQMRESAISASGAFGKRSVRNFPLSNSCMVMVSAYWRLGLRSHHRSVRSAQCATRLVYRQSARDFRCWANAGPWTRESSCKREKSQRATRESCHWKPKRLGAVLRRRSSEHAQRSVPRRHEPRQQERWANSRRNCTFQTILARVTPSAGLPLNARRRYGEISPPMRRIRSRTHPWSISFLSGAGPPRHVRAIQSGLRWRSCLKSYKSRSRLDPKISVGDRRIELRFRMQGDASGEEQMNIGEFDIPGLKLIIPKRFSDVRGHFQETWSDRLFREKIGNVTFVQDNQSLSIKKGTVRGLHFQKPPYAQGKLVRVLQGSILDVSVDIRTGSPTYRRHIAVKLDAVEGAQMWVPPGFLHGFCTLEDQTEVFYKVTSYYSPSHDAGVLWNDPDLGIKSPVDAHSAVLSDKDRQHPRLCDLPAYFQYKE